MISMADSKGKEQKEEHIECKSKTCLPRRESAEVERTFQESARKSSWNHWQTYLKIINDQLDIKLGQVMEEGLDAVLKKMKDWKAVGFEEIPIKVYKTRKFNNIFLKLCNEVYKQNTIEKWTKGCHLPFLNKGDLGISKNYKTITLTIIAAKFYNALLLTRNRENS